MRYLIVIVILLLLTASTLKAQSNSCANGDQLVINTSTKLYQCITPGTQPAGTGTTMIIANDTVTGTTVNRFAKLTGAPSKAIITATSDTENAVGIVSGGAGTTGNATITILGQASCQFDGATTAGNYVILSSTTAGMCHDGGSSYPTSGATYGRVLSTNGGAGTYVMELMTPDIAFQNAGNGKSKPGTPANAYQYNSSNQFAGGSLFRVDANTNQQSNTTNFQTFNLYKTTDSDASPVNYERLQLTGSSGSTAFTIASQAAGTGTARGLILTSDATLRFNSNNTVEVGGSTTQVIPGATNTITLGSATRAWSNVLAVNLFATTAGSIGFNGGSGATFTNGTGSTGALTFVMNATHAGAIRDFIAASGSTNNPDFGTSSLFYRIAPNAAGSTLTGGRDIAQTGEIHEIVNTGSAPLILSNNNSSSNAGRRWLPASNLNLQLAPNQKAPYWFDGSSNNLRVGKFESSETVNVTTQFDKTNTTFGDVTGLTQSVSASRTYNFTAALYYDADVIGGAKFQIAGTATATAVIYQINTICNATNLNVITARQTSLGGGPAGQAGCTAGFTEITGTITVNAAGTLTVQFAQNAATGTSNVLVGSTFYVNNIN